LKTTEILANIKARLPHTTQKIVAILGWEKALKFLRAHGDKERYVPKEYNANHCLFHGLTVAQSKQLIAQFGGEDVKFPSHIKMLSSERYQAILKDYERGFDLIMITNKYNVSKPEVVRVIQRFGVKTNTD